MGLLNALQLWKEKRRQHHSLRQSIHHYTLAAKGFAEKHEDDGLKKCLEGAQRLSDCEFPDVRRKARALLRKFEGRLSS